MNFKERLAKRFKRALKRLPYMVSGVLMAVLLGTIVFKAIGPSLVASSVLVALAQAAAIAASRRGHFGLYECLDSMGIGFFVTYPGNIWLYFAVWMVTSLSVHFVSGLIGKPEVKEPTN